MQLAISFIGGLMIGSAALLLYAAAGRIAGISGILGGAIWEKPQERTWRTAFVIALVAGGWLATLLLAGGDAHTATSSAPLLIISGLLVGFGTRLGNGCTSGHGVCGLARLSPRSLASVVTFMGIGMLSATLLRPLLFGGN